MNLEKEISSRFDNNFHKVVVNILYTCGWMTTIIRERLRQHEVTIQQFNILRILRGQHPNPATINLLKERMLDKMSDASRIVDRLIQKELVSREVNQSDRRAVDIVITEKGLALLKEIDKDMLGADIVQKNISEDEAAQLNMLLDKLRG
jgi:DNA-binding MarR family transcriptional regulator